jgi:thymidylate synthase (FAD)
MRANLDKTLLVKTVRSAARSVMPNSTETYLFWSANARSLRHYIEMRASQHADIEIRKVAVQILKIMQREAPNLFGDYRLVDLPDGTEEAQTDHIKV